MNGGSVLSSFTQRTIPAYSAIVFAVGSQYYARDDTGATITAGKTDLNQTLTDVNDSALIADGDTIWIQPGTYNVGASKSEAVFSKSLSIFMHGVTLLNATSRTGAKMLKQNGAGKYLKLYGGTLDGGNLYGVLFGADANIDIGNLECYQTTFKNRGATGGFGISCGSNDGTLMPTCNVIVGPGCVFEDDGATNSGNEAITTDSINSVTLYNPTISGNKGFYLSARYVKIYGVQHDAGAYTGGLVNSINAEETDAYGIYLDNAGLYLRNFGDIHQDFRHGTAKRINIDGFTVEGASEIPLQLEPFNSTTNRLETVTLKNLNVSDTGVRILSFDDTALGKIDQLTIQNITMQDFDGNLCIVLSENVSIDNLLIDGFNSPTAWNANGSPLRVVSEDVDVTVNLFECRNFVTNPATYITTTHDGGAGRTTIIRVLRPLINGGTSNRALGAGTQTVTYWNAKGTGSILSTNTAVTITHGLAYTPVAGDIVITPTENPTNTPGLIWVDTITSTQFNVNCENDPGASNLDFSWRAIRP